MDDFITLPLHIKGKVIDFRKKHQLAPGELKRMLAAQTFNANLLGQAQMQQSQTSGILHDLNMQAQQSAQGTAQSAYGMLRFLGL